MLMLSDLIASLYTLMLSNPIVSLKCNSYFETNIYASLKDNLSIVANLKKKKFSLLLKTTSQIVTISKARDELYAS